MKELSLKVESLIFASDTSISIDEIKYILDTDQEVPVDMENIRECIQELIAKYNSEEYSFGIVEISNGYSFMTKREYHQTVGTYLKSLNTKKLSRAALETLAIIAYKQPATKAEIEQIRGVNSDYTIQKLLEKNLIEIEGRDDGPGRALIYSTSKYFMDYFGLKSMTDLPGYKDFDTNENSVGVEEEE